MTTPVSPAAAGVTPGPVAAGAPLETPVPDPATTNPGPFPPETPGDDVTDGTPPEGGETPETPETPEPPVDGELPPEEPEDSSEETPEEPADEVDVVEDYWCQEHGQGCPPGCRS